jgi:hypothetical protein
MFTLPASVSFIRLILFLYSFIIFFERINLKIYPTILGRNIILTYQQKEQNTGLKTCFVVKFNVLFCILYFIKCFFFPDSNCPCDNSPSRQFGHNSDNYPARQFNNNWNSFINWTKCNTKSSFINDKVIVFNFYKSFKRDMINCSKFVCSKKLLDTILLLLNSDGANN